MTVQPLARVNLHCGSPSPRRRVSFYLAFLLPFRPPSSAVCLSWSVAALAQCCCSVLSGFTLLLGKVNVSETTGWYS